jgi:CheY-like chemotaxis protein
MGRRGHYNQEVLNLNVIVLQAVQELMPLTENMTCTTNLDPKLLNVLGGGSQIHRVITNLLCNAVDALQSIGHIVVTTENYYADNDSGTYGRVPRGEYVKLTISDTGCGIPDDIVPKVLDPFFTTKVSDKKRGSGLGLSVVDAVVKDHGGYLDLDTKLGKGTSFYVYLPTTREAINSSDADRSSGGSEKILVIDDDDMQREVSTRLLEKLGYVISTVDSGEKAIEFLREHPQDLLIIDMVMPGGIDGAETYGKILQNHPTQKAIIVSGFSESSRVQVAQSLGAGAFVKKPLTRRAIAAAVREELDRQTKDLV